MSTTEPSPELDLTSRFAGLSTSRGARDGTTGSFGYEETAGDSIPDSKRSAPKYRNDDKEHIQSLVHDAREALSRSTELEDSTASTAKNKAPRHPIPRLPISGNTGLKGNDKDVWKLDDPSSDSDENDDYTDDEQANEILQNIIDELDVEPEPEPESEPSKTGPDNTSPNPSSPPSAEQKEHPSKTQQTDLPTTTPPPPSSSPTPPPPAKPTSEPPSIHNLPDAPTFLPEPTADHDLSSFRKGSSWRDNDADPHWCCICSDDATRKCFGCEGDLLYCLRCWNEVHIEEGFEEEREHQWVRWAAPDRGR